METLVKSAGRKQVRFFLPTGKKKTLILESRKRNRKQFLED